MQGISSEEILSFQKNQITKIAEIRNYALKINFFAIFSCISYFMMLLSLKMIYGGGQYAH